MHRNASLGILAIAALALLACDGTTHAAGRVRDTHGRAIAGVAVRLESGGVSTRAVTDGAGRYSVTQSHGTGKTAADLTFCKAGYHLARRWFDDSRSIPRILDVTVREIKTTDTPERIAGARAPCEALGGRAPDAKPNAR